MDFNAVVERTNKILSTPLQWRDINDLSELQFISHQISILIPLSKLDLKRKEIEADTVEKETIINFRKSWVKMNVEQMKAEARVLKNKLLLEANELEYKYLTLYQFYQDLQSAIASTRLVLKLI